MPPLFDADSLLTAKFGRGAGVGFAPIAIIVWLLSRTRKRTFVQAGGSWQLSTSTFAPKLPLLLSFDSVDALRIFVPKDWPTGPKRRCSRDEHKIRAHACCMCRCAWCRAASAATYRSRRTASDSVGGDRPLGVQCARSGLGIRSGCMERSEGHGRRRPTSATRSRTPRPGKPAGAIRPSRGKSSLRTLRNSDSRPFECPWRGTRTRTKGKIDAKKLARVERGRRLDHRRGHVLCRQHPLGWRLDRFERASSALQRRSPPSVQKRRPG